MSSRLPRALIATVFLVVAGGVGWLASERGKPSDPQNLEPRAEVVPQSRVSERSARVARSGDEPALPAEGVIAGGDRFVAGEVLDARMIDSRGREPVERWRLVRLPEDPGRIARVVDELAPNPDNGGWRLLRQSIMRADSLVVGIPVGGSAADLAGRLTDAGFALARIPHQGDAVIDVRLPRADLDSVPVGLARIAEVLPDVVAEPNFLYFPLQTTPSDYEPAALWGLENIEAPVAWTTSTGSGSVVVAVLDTGVDVNHPDLQANIWVNPGEVAGNNLDDDGNGWADDVHGWNSMGNNADVSDTEGHGTHVAGTIGAVGNNGFGVTGVAWQVRLIAVRVGTKVFENSAAIEGLRYVNTLRARGVPIVAVNASFGGGSPSTLFRQELEISRDRGVLFVAAAGNDGTSNDTTPFYPASYDVENVISVASIHQGNGLSVFSNHGSASVDLAAPGTGIRSTIPAAQYGVKDGTSMAAPHVTGAVVLLAATNPALTWRQLRDRILTSVEPVAALSGRVATGGRLSLRRAVAPQVPRLRVAIAEPAARVLALDRAGLSVALQGTVLSDNGSTPAASLQWDADGPAGAVEIAAPANGATTATFTQSGVYRLRLRGTAGAITASDAITVAVGTTSVSSTGLRGWWQFAETGNTAGDSSGHARDGVVTGASRTTGAVGGALLFDGLDDNVRFTVPPLPRLTVSAWVRADGRGINPYFPRVVHMREGLLFFGLGTAGAPDGNTGTLKFALDNGLDGRVWHSAPGSIGLGPWHHVAVTYDPTSPANSPRLYVDGVAQVVSEQSGTSAAGTPTVAAGAGFIGDRGDGARPWAGSIDEVRLFDRELAAAEVALLAAEARLRALTADVQVADLLPESTGVAQLVLAAGATLPAGTTVAWSVSHPAVAGLAASSATGATLRTHAPGETLLHVALTLDGVRCVHSAILRVSDPVVVSRGAYTATAGAGSVRLWYDEAGGTVLLAAGGELAPVYARGFAINEAGSFAFSTAAGNVVTGRVGSAGVFSGSVDGVAFSGSRAGSAASSGGGGLQSFGGYLVRTDVRVRGVLDGDALAMVVEDPAAGVVLDLVRQPGEPFVNVVGTPAASGVLQADVFDGAARLQADGVERRFVLVRDGARKFRRLANLSARGPAGTGEAPMIAGFFVTGAGADVLVRAVGPGLVHYGVNGVLARPRLELFSGSAMLTSNEVWHQSPDAATLASTAGRLNAFDLRGDESDAAVLARLPAGGFTVLVSGAGGAQGVVLAEAYDAGAEPATEALINVSARCRVGQGDAVLIAGFVIDGEVPQLVLVRGVGPALVNHGIVGFLADPTLEVFQGQTAFAANDNWDAGSAAGATRLAQVMAAAGAFGLEPGSRDAAMLLSLPPGAYTAIVRGVAGTEGVALVEVYRVSE